MSERLVVVLILWLSVMIPVWATERVALVIGNSAYTAVPRLNNPGNDAHDLAIRLRMLGFSVEEAYDLDERGMRRSLQTFARSTDGAEVALVFFAGHGIEVDGQNWLIPVDAHLQSVHDVEFEAIPLDLVLRSVGGAQQLRLVILDACRDNPFATLMQRSGASRSIGRGLGRIEPIGGTLVAYAARDGTTADDGRGRNSPFTQALLEVLEEPGVEISLLFRQVRDRVLQRTGQRQEPFTYGSLPSTALYLYPPHIGSEVKVAEAPVSTALGVSADALELAFWQSIQSSRDASDFEAYLRRYPQGSFKELAHNRLAGLRLQTDASEMGDQVRLAIRVTPADARVRIMNIVPTYREGMRLDPGRYDIEVSAPGYRTYRMWHDLDAGDQVIEVALQAQTPASVQIDAYAHITGPSFNCSAATQPVERLLCDDRTLAHMDGVMGALYQQLRQRMSGADRQILRQQQLAWIKSRDDICPVTLRELSHGPARDHSVTCLQGMMQNRADQLKVILERTP